MKIAESALFAAIEHYTDLLSTPHTNVMMWRRKLLRAKAAIAVLSQWVEEKAHGRQGLH